MPYAAIASRCIEYERIDVASADRPTLIFLHEGLGVDLDVERFPTACRACDLVQRVGVFALRIRQFRIVARARTVRDMHEEALVALPELLDGLAIEQPILIGHSDGASIALIHAGGSGRAVRGLVLLAPHVFVEEITVASIAAAKVAYETTDLRERLAKHHRDVDSAFWGWSRIWLDSEFRQWNVEEYLPRIRVPILAMRGEDDEYETMEQLARIARGASDVELLELADCRHSVHRDQPETVIEAVTRFVDRITGGR